MAINSVDMTKALKNEAYAAQVIRSGKCTASERGQLAAQWGADKITKWESVDSTQYEITDDQKQTAKANGTERAKKGAQVDADGNVNNEGFDGKADDAKTKGNTVATAVSAGGSVAATVAAVLAGFKNALSSKASGFLVLASGVFLLAQSLILKALNPNEEQAQACDNMAPVLKEADDELEDYGNEVSSVTNNLTGLTDDLIKVDESSEKAQKIKEDEYERMLAEQQRLLQKYEASKTGGETFTSDDRARLDALNIQLSEKFLEIGNIKAAGDEKKAGLTENLEDSQELYDDLGSKIEEVQAMTEEQAQYDQATVDNAQEVKTASRVGQAASALTIVAGAIHAWKVGSLFASAEGFAAVGGMASAAGAGVVFQKVASQQEDYKNRAQAGVDKRVETEELNIQTTETYEKDLDTYASNIEFKDEIEFENTEYTEPTSVTVGDDTSQPSDGTDKSTVNPFAPPSSKGVSDGVGVTGDDDSNSSGGDDDKKEKI